VERKRRSGENSFGDAPVKREAIQAVLRGDSKPHLPGLLQVRMPEDLLIQSIPHWLYKGDTALHLAGVRNDHVRDALR
jgi:hypothetical protein